MRDLHDMTNLCIGFTGTQAGLTPKAVEILTSNLRSYREDHHFINFRHGDCVGADAQAHDIAMALGFTVIIHPPLINSMRAHKKGHQWHPARPYLERNKNIVRGCHLLVACPKDSMNEELRSGTWSTVRFARKAQKSILLISARMEE